MIGCTCNLLQIGAWSWRFLQDIHQDFITPAINIRYQGTIWDADDRQYAAATGHDIARSPYCYQTISPPSFGSLPTCLS